MVDLDSFVRPSQLWKRLSADSKQLAAEAFWRDESAAGEQAEAVGIIAQRIKFRPKSVKAMPIEKRARQLVALPSVSETLVVRLLVSYHLAHQRPMMGAFLESLGIAHEDGLISDEELTPPPAERLAEAARALAAAFPREDAALYLSTLIWQDPDTWGGLANLPEVQEGQHAPDVAPSQP